YEQARSNHPERAPREQLELAFERVVEMLGAEKPSNDQNPGTDESPAEAKQDAGPARRRKKGKQRDRHGRRPLDRTNLPVIEHRITPDEVKAAGGRGYELVGEESSDRIALRPAAWVIYRVIREKY